MQEPVGVPKHNGYDERMLLLARSAAAGFRSLSLAADGGSSEDVGGALCWYSNSYVPVFNGAAILDESLFSQPTIGLVERYFRHRAHPYSIMTLDGLVPRSAEKMARFNYDEYDSMPAMWLEGEPANSPAASRDVWVRQVDSPVPLSVFRRILSAVFHLSMSEVNLVLGERTLSIKHVRHYLGWMGNTPVGTASLVLFDGVAGVWNVGTLSEYRHRGVAATLMHHILSEARALGYQQSMLLASNDGQPLYERLGYETLSHVRVFVPTR
jgi:ribosomal protein S18 acetylase RimI-like enzyme